jgi:hypothetical protein
MKNSVEDLKSAYTPYTPYTRNGATIQASVSPVSSGFFSASIRPWHFKQKERSSCNYCEKIEYISFLLIWVLVIHQIE